MQVKALNNSFESGSYNEGYTPDVITIRKNDIANQTLVGEYTITVRGATFSSYSILFYTHEASSSTAPENPEDIKPITSNIIELDTGKIIKDFIIQQKNFTSYKIYSYNPKLSETEQSMDIRVTLTPEHSEYKVYVLFDINNIKFNASSYDPIANYIWKSNYNNEIIIKKTDKQYKKNQNYYIIVVPSFYYQSFDLFANDTSSNSTANYLDSMYYIGVTNEVYPFILQESYPSTISLDSNYTSQAFWYYHYNISNPVSISLNVYYGRVDIYVDFKWQENIIASTSAIKVLETDSTYFTIPPTKLKENSQGYPSVPLYILVKKSSALDSQFLLSLKSNTNMPELLKQGFIRKDNLLSGEYKYFFLYLRKDSSAVLNVAFKYGYGNSYVNIYDINDFVNSNKYPDITNYMHKSQDNYMGKSLAIQKNMLEKCEMTCKILIAIHGSNLGYADDKIEYAISYYQDTLLINQNQPFKSGINRGEMQFFRVYFPKNTKNVYISLTNMQGDADLYVNYGDDLPSIGTFTWSSASPNSEFVEFNSNDSYFVANNKNDIAGNYTIMIYGFEKTTYTLYVTSHPKKIISLEDNSPASCVTNKDNDYCYFRFDDLYQFYWGDIVYGVDDNSNTGNIGENLKQDLNLIVNSEFIYGGGIIYAKLYNDTDYDILQDFPDENNYDYSNINSNIRNYMRMNIKSDNPNFNSNSTILITVKCLEKCFFDLMATKQYQSTIRYLDYSRENVYYVSKAENKKNLFIYYNNKQGDIDVFVKALEGKANIKIYTNNTLYSKSSEGVRNEINQLESFISRYPQEETIHKPLAATNLTLYDNVYFEVDPVTDYTFILRLTYQHDWTKIQFGKPNLYRINPSKMRFYGFFHMNNIYDNVLFSVWVNKKNLSVYVYVKYVVYDKKDKTANINQNQDNNSKEFDLAPSEKDHDYSGNNMNLMNLIAMRLPKVPKEKLEDKHLIKILFSIYIFDFNHNNNLNSEKANSISTDNDNIELHITATPEINNVLKSEIPQNTIHYSSLEGFEKNNSTVQIFDLKRKNVEDDTLYVEISSCKGLVDLVMSKLMLNSIRDAEQNLLHPISIQNSNGKAIYKFNNLDADHYYMMLKGKQVPDYTCLEKQKNGDIQKCSATGNTSSSNVLVYYYTTKSADEKKESIIPRESIIYEVLDMSSIKIKWTPLIEFNNESENIHEKVKLTPANYEIYISNSIKDYIYMDSVCYLNSMKPTTLKIEIDKNNKEAKIFGIKPNEKYFINILAKKKDDMDVIAYKSIEVILEMNSHQFIFSN